MRQRALAASALVAVLLALTPPADAHHVTKADLVAMVDGTFGPAASTARRIVACESTWNHLATHRNRNGTTDYGLFQINSGGTLQALGLTPTTALDPQANIDAAYKLYKQRGWRPWVCSSLRKG